MASTAEVETKIVVRVIAKAGKFLADDIGGALVTITDAQTGQFLISGRTQGLSGPPLSPDPVMCICRYRSQAILNPSEAQNVSKFEWSTGLSEPRLLKFTARGPLAAPGSANEASATQWVYPGKSLDRGDGLVLELPGLVVQIVNPITHYMPAQNPGQINIQANVTMMCGCPITETPHCPPGPGVPQPWPAGDFDVFAVITEYSPTGQPISQTPPIDLQFTTSNLPSSQFAKVWKIPKPATYEVLVCAYQKTNGNTGIARATMIIPS